MTRLALSLLSLATALALAACARNDDQTASQARADAAADVATTPSEPAPSPAPATAPANPVTLGDAETPPATAAHFTQLDADRSGTVLPAEHAASAAAMFNTMDTNGDRRVTVEEMDAARGPLNADTRISSADKIEVLDADHDGVLTAEEHAGGSKLMFEQMDANKDGQLTLAEVDVGHDRTMGQQQ
jgi:hypothetical protein